MQAVQDVLVSAARGLPGAGAASGDHGVQLEMLRSSAGAAGEKENAALLAPHALMEHIGDRVPEAGAGESPEWQSFAARKVRASRELGGADKVAFAYAWLARFREQADFRDVASALDRSGAVADGRDTLSTLFLTGVIDHSEIVEQRLDDDGLGFQVDILGRVYQLDPAGSLEKLPSG